MKTILYLVRHAQSHPSARIPHAQWPLSKVGERQAIKLCDLLKPLGIEKIFSSPFDRCLQTIQPFVDTYGIDIHIHQELRERQIAKELIDDFYMVWNKSWEDFNFALPECESSSTAQKRFVNTIREILRENTQRTLGISTHGNVMGLFLNHIDPTFGRKQAEQIKNPYVIKVVAEETTFVWDQQFHLPGLEEIVTDHTETPVDKNRETFSH